MFSRGKTGAAPMRLYLAIALALIAAGTVSPAFASNVLDTTTNTFQQATTTFGTKMQTLGMGLLFSLAGIEMAVAGIKKLLGNQIDFSDILLGVLVKQIFIIGFWYAMIHSASTYLPAIINGFSTAGQQGSGLSQLSPSAIVDQGIQLMGVMKQSFTTAAGGGSSVMALLQNPIPALEFFGIEIIIFLAFTVLAFQMVLAVISGYFWTAVTPLLLGFGGLSFTRDMAMNALKGGVSIGMKLLVTYLLAGVATNLATTIGTAMGGVSMTNMQPMWECAATAIIFAYLSWQLPKIASDLLNGTSSLSAGEAIQQGAMMGAAAVGLAAAGAGAAGLAAKGAGSAAVQGMGLGRALSAGMNSGLDLGKSGTAAAAHAMGEVGSHSLGLVKGALGGAGSAFSQKVDSSVGGQIASSINATRGGSMSGIPVPPDANPGGAGGSGSGGASPHESAAAIGENAAGSSSTGNSPAGNSPAASSAADAGTPAPTTSATGSVPVPQSNASTASISGGSSNPVKPPQASRLSKAQQGLQTFASQVPQDSHTVGVNANIGHSGE